MLDYFEALLNKLQIGSFSPEGSANPVLYLPEYLNIFRVTFLHKKFSE